MKFCNLVVVFSFILLTQPVALAFESPDLLVAGARSQKLSHLGGKLTLRITTVGSGKASEDKASHKQLHIEWVGDSFWFVQSEGDDHQTLTEQYRSVYHEGEVLHHFIAGESVTISNRDQLLSGYLFDPRTLGANTVESNQTAESVLFPPHKGSARYIGTEQVGGILCDHIVWEWNHGGETELWIGRQPSFPIVKLRVGGSTVVNEYADDGVSIPIKTTRRRELPDGRIYTTTKERLSLDLSLPSPERQKTIFNLASLNIPIGMPVADNRINEIVGYWNGSGLSDSRSEAYHFATEDNQSPNWLPWIVSGVTLALICWFANHRRHYYSAR